MDHVKTLLGSILSIISEFIHLGAVIFSIIPSFAGHLLTL